MPTALLISLKDDAEMGHMSPTTPPLGGHLASVQQELL